MIPWAQGPKTSHTSCRGWIFCRPGLQHDTEKPSLQNLASKNIKIGRLYLNGTDSKIDKAVDQALADGQFQVIPLDVAFKAKWEQAQRDGTAAAVGAWISDRKYFGKPGVSAKTEAIIALGEFEYTPNYRNALKRQANWQYALRQVFKKADLIALPTLQKLPPTIPPLGSTVFLEAQVLSLQNTAAVNFAGNPALAIPIPVNDKTIPVTGLQLIGPRLSEAELLNAGRLIEASVKGLVDRSVLAKSARKQIGEVSDSVRELSAAAAMEDQ